MDFNPDAMRKRFHELGRKRAEIVSNPALLDARAKYEALRAEECALRDKQKPLIEEIRRLEAGLFDIDQERGVLNRALAGRTGESG